jgi:lipoic acid synthetase
VERRKPEWLSVRPPSGPRYLAIKDVARTRRLATVCEEARCPNVAECWGGGTATFMMMGETCTRGCRFCAVATAKQPPPPDPDEPRHLVEAICAMGLDYVVLTSVNRDDLPDEGAGHVARCIATLRHDLPALLVEVLIPDFSGRTDLIADVVAAGPHVLAHNLETVARLTPRVRDRRAGYAQSLSVLREVGRIAPHLFTKSSLMLGLGETTAEVLASMRDLREEGVALLTLGQYLQPTRQHLPVEEFIAPETFAWYERVGLELGFAFVAAGPLVRSSYRAGELFMSRVLRAGAAVAPVAARAMPAEA